MTFRFDEITEARATIEYTAEEQAELEQNYQEYVALGGDLGDRYTLAGFAEQVNRGCFNNDDGSAYYAHEMGKASQEYVDLDRPIPDPHPDGWTHILWFGK